MVGQQYERVRKNSVLMATTLQAEEIRTQHCTLCCLLRLNSVNNHLLVLCPNMSAFKDNY